jgi:cation transport ATPase
MFMELNELKVGWQNAGGNYRTESDLARMTKLNYHPTLKRIRIKLIIETVVLSFFLVVYYDWFDGDKKPLYANLLLFCAVLLYILNDVIGYISLAKPVMKENLRSSVQHLLSKVKRLSILSLVISFLYSVCLLAFFLSIITFTKEKSFILLGMILVLVQLTHISYKVWRNWILKLELQVNDFAAE